MDGNGDRQVVGTIQRVICVDPLLIRLTLADCRMYGIDAVYGRISDGVRYGKCRPVSLRVPSNRRIRLRSAALAGIRIHLFLEINCLTVCLQFVYRLPGPVN